jgi:hypothetical protein
MILGAMGRCKQTATLPVNYFVGMLPGRRGGEEKSDAQKLKTGPKRLPGLKLVTNKQDARG